MTPLVEVVGLTKHYGSKRGVVDLSFQVAEGEVFGFLGPNGAGKTTTMRLLMSLLFPHGGSARIAGLDCWRRSVEVKRVLGYLPGELALDPNLTGGQIRTLEPRSKNRSKRLTGVSARIAGDWRDIPNSLDAQTFCKLGVLLALTLIH